MFDGNKVGILGKAVDHNKDGVTSVSVKETFNEVHCNIDSDLRRDEQRLEQSRRFDGLVISALTSIAGSNQGFNCFLQAIPIEILTNPFIDLKKD